MAPYQQTCKCKGQAVSAVRDAVRYDREAEETRQEIALLERELAKLHAKAKRARIRALGEEYGSCTICADTGHIEGNGSAQVGGSGRSMMVISAERIG